MNVLKCTLLLFVLIIGFASCASRRGWDHPIRPTYKTGWHRGQGYGHGAGYHNAPRNYHK